MSEIAQQIIEELKLEFPITGFSPVSGGDINQSYCLTTGNEPLFLKVNAQVSDSNFFRSEAFGLSQLEQTNFLVPKVLKVGVNFLLMSWLQASSFDANSWVNFGLKLAQMHKLSSKTFGLESDNYIGTLPQSNATTHTWTEFFVTQRLEPQIKSAVDSGIGSKAWIVKLDQLSVKLNNLIPEELPALLHGDLWSGNVMNTYKGCAIFDPSVYYGHREMDLAMARLFGGFGSEMLGAYHSEFAIEPGFLERVDLHNLYPLLVHVNLFGGAYVDQVERVFKRFVG